MVVLAEWKEPSSPSPSASLAHFRTTPGLRPGVPALTGRRVVVSLGSRR